MIAKVIEELTGLLENEGFLVCSDGENFHIEYTTTGDFPPHEEVLQALGEQPELLLPYKTEAIEKVNKENEACRIKIGTPIWFQDSLYQMKAEEAARFYDKARKTQCFSFGL